PSANARVRWLYHAFLRSIAKALRGIVLSQPFPCVNLLTSMTAPPAPATNPTVVSTETMQTIYEEVRTPYKYGVVLRNPGVIIDCPSVYRVGEKWRMFYIQWTDEIGYETHLADSDDLLHWEPRGNVLSFRKEPTWDQWQAGGTIQLIDHHW